MIYDRPYMRSEHDHGRGSALIWTLAVTIGVFVLQSILVAWFDVSIDRWLGLSVPAVQSGWLWTTLSYGLLHSTSNPFHVIFNALCIYFLGREVLPRLGNNRFLILYVGAILLGGLGWLPIAMMNDVGVPLVGASAAVFALLTVFACLSPDRPITLLLFFIIPVTVRPRILAYVAAGASLFFLLFFEIVGRGGVVAHSSHLAGMAAGWLYYRYLHDRTGEFGSLRPSVEMPAWLSRKKKATPETPFKVDVSGTRDMKAEIDRILDKINAHGFGSLSVEERRILDNARDVLNRH
ncbi:rhomboid family intramembrane serine protease [Congregicoccus parvus]|uniref:rhomboid family intramembrane serine protease n=1 Tax=Congregicoccus parvus TaxID=3081749 RepID=UPI003FA573C8